MTDLKVETTSQIIWVRDDGIVYYQNKKIDKHELKHAKENVAAASNIISNAPALAIIDIRNARFVTTQARSYYAGKENKKITKAAALLIDSPVTRILGNFFMGINKSEFPTKLFTNEEDAIKWLKSLD